MFEDLSTEIQDQNFLTNFIHTIFVLEVAPLPGRSVKALGEKTEV